MILTHGLLIRPAIRHADRTHSDIVVCTIQRDKDNWWTCTVVKGSETYPVGSYNLAIHGDDLRNGIMYEAAEVSND